MRILFMGTPEIAALCLGKILEAGMDVAAVFTKPDMPAQRGMKTSFSPVKRLAVAHGIAVYQPSKIRRCQPLFDEIRPDICVVAAYGRLLPDWMLSYPEYGCINMHASLLPHLRGAAPIQRAVQRGDTLGGVTTMYIASEMDTGDIIYSAETPITPEDTGGTLYERYAELGGALLVRTLQDIEAGVAPRISQDDSRATFAPPITPEEAQVDWTRPAAEIFNLIRAFNPNPTAFTTLDGVNLNLYASRVGEGGGEPGTVLASKRMLEVAAGEGSVIITELQAAGGKRMAAADWLNGHRVAVGTKLQ